MRNSWLGLLMSRQHIILDLNLSLIPHAQIHKKSCVCVYAKLCIYLWVYTVVPPYLLDLRLVPGYPPPCGCQNSRTLKSLHKRVVFAYNLHTSSCILVYFKSSLDCLQYLIQCKYYVNSCKYNVNVM